MHQSKYAIHILVGVILVLGVVAVASNPVLTGNVTLFDRIIGYVQNKIKPVTDIDQGPKPTPTLGATPRPTITATIVPSRTSTPTLTPTPTPACTSDAQCPDDGNVCTASKCVNGQCVQDTTSMNGANCPLPRGGQGFCKNGACKPKTCTELFGSNFDTCSEGGCCRKGGCCEGDCCSAMETCVQRTWGADFCNPTRCVPGKKLCPGSDWNWCCPSDMDCGVTHDVAECVRNNGCQSGETACGTNWDFGGGTKCCNQFETCNTKSADYSYPTCVAKNVDRPGYVRCVGTGSQSWRAIWCKIGTEVCGNTPGGHPKCFPV